MEFITDRTQYHVTLLKHLQAKGWNNMTSSEKVSWRKEAAKGAYNYTDLNRVESAVAEIAKMMGLNLTTKTDWSLWDIPLKSDMDRYLRNVIAIRDLCPKSMKFPSLPKTMNHLTFEYANNIEKVLKIAYESYGDYCEKYVQSGEIYCGEV